MTIREEIKKEKRKLGRNIKANCLKKINKNRYVSCKTNKDIKDTKQVSGRNYSYPLSELRGPQLVSGLNSSSLAAQ